MISPMASQEPVLRSAVATHPAALTPSRTSGGPTGAPEISSAYENTVAVTLTGRGTLSASPHKVAAQSASSTTTSSHPRTCSHGSRWNASSRPRRRAESPRQHRTWAGEPAGLPGARHTLQCKSAPFWWLLSGRSSRSIAEVMLPARKLDAGPCSKPARAGGRAKCSNITAVSAVPRPPPGLNVLRFGKRLWWTRKYASAPGAPGRATAVGLPETLSKARNSPPCDTSRRHTTDPACGSGSPALGDHGRPTCARLGPAVPLTQPSMSP